MAEAKRVIDVGELRITPGKRVAPPITHLRMTAGHHNKRLASPQR
jgi:hypothetical protein